MLLEHSFKVMYLAFNSFPASVFKKVASHRQHFLSFSQNFHGPQNILLYEYLKMQKKGQRLRF